jgi:uncharacterized damage-inducible protein DinB
MSRPLLSDAFAHHVWATLRVIDACLVLTPKQLETTVPGTYGSIIETLRHTVGADVGYLELLSDGGVAEIDDSTMDLAGLRAAMAADGLVWAALLARDLDADAMVTRHREDGSESSAPLGIRLAQVIHHGTDHRSQICTALTALGSEPPAIDVWDFAEQDDRLVTTEPTAAT